MLALSIVQMWVVGFLLGFGIHWCIGTIVLSSCLAALTFLALDCSTSFIHSFSYSSIHSFIHSFIHSCVHGMIHYLCCSFYVSFVV